MLWLPGHAAHGFDVGLRLGVIIRVFVFRDREREVCMYVYVAGYTHCMMPKLKNGCFFALRHELGQCELFVVEALEG